MNAKSEDRRARCTDNRLRGAHRAGSPQAKGLPPPVSLPRPISSSKGLFKGASLPPQPSTAASCLSPFLELGPGFGTQACRGWKENIASFLLVISPQGDWKIHRHSCCRAVPGLGVGICTFTPPFLCSSCCPDSHICCSPSPSPLCPHNHTCWPSELLFSCWAPLVPKLQGLRAWGFDGVL